jgi:hypothetical protein
MKKLNRLILIITIFLLTFGVSLSQTITKLKAQSSAPQQAVTPAAASNPVTGSGTVGRLSKWTGVDGSNSFALSNSNIFEDKFGKVGIGTTAPTSLLTVQGMIETTLGGYKFPDGTIQTTAAVTGLQSVFHDTSLTGNGTSSSPLGISVFHDATLTGIGTSSSPLGVRVPLFLNGNSSVSILTVLNNESNGAGIGARGGDADSTAAGGTGVRATGGDSDNDRFGGTGLVGTGGKATKGGEGGEGGLFFGGNADANRGGIGVFTTGGIGRGTGKKGGIAILADPGRGMDGATDGFAGQFQGDVVIFGNLAKGGGSFKIDHPLDPENKYLYHSFVESPDMMNIYNGNITTDTNGEAVIEMPDYFESLNRDFRYQLTVIGTFAQAIVAEKMKGNQFRIKTNAPNVEVSWQVTGVRQDAYANKHRIPVVENKTATERGSYLHPEAFNKPRERGVSFRQNPELMQKISEQSEQLKQKAQQEQK